jgi:hypothetical protein
MQGLTKGEQSNATNPILQLYVRQEGHLVAPYSANYTIENLRNPDMPVTTVVNMTNVDLVVDKLGTGRFVINSGPTTSWACGTYRAVCKYKLVDGGREYVQVIKFEVLDSVNYPTGQDYKGYVTTRSLYEKGIAGFADTPPENLHPAIMQAAHYLETQLKRFFEPRYVEYFIDGSGKRVLPLEEAIIAIEEVAEVDKLSDNTYDAKAYGTDGYEVFNRHLNGLLQPDDRHNPQLHTISDFVNGRYNLGFLWPAGTKNLRIKGVFGYTDPSIRDDGTLIGNTPQEIEQACCILISRDLEDALLEDPSAQRPGLVKKFKTRHQVIEFYGASGNVNYAGGITGDPLLDQKLLAFASPTRLDYL